MDGVDYSSVSQSRKRLNVRREHDPKLKDRFGKIIKKLYHLSSFKPPFHAGFFTVKKMIILSITLMERKSRMPQIQGVQRRMPYAAAKQQPSTCEPLATPEMGVSCCSYEQPLSRRVNKMEKKRTFITHHYG